MTVCNNHQKKHGSTVKNNHSVWNVNALRSMSLSTDQRSQSAGEAELRELLKVIEQKQRFQALVLGLTELCWETCMDTPSTRLDDRTSNCMLNCVERFIDTTNFVSNRLKYAVTDLVEREQLKKN